MPKNPLENNHRILVIDDNESIHRDFRRILAKREARAELGMLESELFGNSEIHPPTDSSAGLLDIEIDSAYQGREGLDRVKQSIREDRRYSLAFVDMRMPPGWDGLETIQRIFAVDPLIQIVICTAFSDHSWSEITDCIGSSDRLLILKKPFDTIEVSQLVIALCKKTELAQQTNLATEDLERLVQEKTAELLAANRAIVEEQQKSMERERQLLHQQKVKSLGHLASSMAHEFRQSLAVIHNFVEVVQESPALEKHAEERELLKIALEATQKAAKITSRVLEYGRQENSGMTVMEVAEAIKRTLSMLTPLFGARCTLAFTPPSQTLHLHCEHSFVDQILMNLCTNARDAMNGVGRIQIFLKRDDLPSGSQIPRSLGAPNVLVEPREWFSITISDMGCGIPAEELQKILDPFYTTKRRGEGTGLGLPITNTLVQRHGGCVKIESTVGTGTKIRLYLPLAKRPIVRSSGITQPIPAGMLPTDVRNIVPATGS